MGRLWVHVTIQLNRAPLNEEQLLSKSSRKRRRMNLVRRLIRERKKKMLNYIDVVADAAHLLAGPLVEPVPAHLPQDLIHAPGWER
jgi:hypothetical protein